jgi:hypothetical protein
MTIPRLGKKRSESALDFSHEDEDATETVDPDALGGPEDPSQMYDRHDYDSFFPNDNEDVFDDDHHYDADHPTNNDAIMDDDDDGIKLVNGIVK